MIRTENIRTKEAASVHNQTLVAEAVLLLNFNILLHSESESRLVEISVLVVRRDWRTGSSSIQVRGLHDWGTENEVLQLTLHERLRIREVHRSEVVSGVSHEVTDGIRRQEPHTVFLRDIEQVESLLSIQKVILVNSSRRSGLVDDGVHREFVHFISQDIVNALGNGVTAALDSESLSVRLRLSREGVEDNFWAHGEFVDRQALLRLDRSREKVHEVVTVRVSGSGKSGRSREVNGLSHEGNIFAPDRDELRKLEIRLTELDDIVGDYLRDEHCTLLATRSVGNRGHSFRG